MIFAEVDFEQAGGTKDGGGRVFWLSGGWNRVIRWLHYAKMVR